MLRRFLTTLKLTTLIGILAAIINLTNWQHGVNAERLTVLSLCDMNGDNCNRQGAGWYTDFGTFSLNMSAGEPCTSLFSPPLPHRGYVCLFWDLVPRTGNFSYQWHPVRCLEQWSVTDISGRGVPNGTRYLIEWDEVPCINGTGFANVSGTGSANVSGGSGLLIG